MKIICTVVYFHLMMSLSLIMFETGADPVTPCTSPGQQIGDTVDSAVYYVCLPNGTGGFIPYPQVCPIGGVFLPDPTNPGCIEEPEESTTTTESTTTPEEEELPVSSTPESDTTTELPTSSTPEPDESETELPSTTEEATSPSTAEDSTTTASDSETSAPTTPPPAVYTCPAEGKYPDPVEPCAKFYQCIQVGSVWYFYVYTCPAGTNYDAILKLCTTAPCASAPITTTTTTTASPNPTTTTTTTTVAPPTTTTAPPANTCPSEGKFPVAGNCMSYYQCLLFNSIWYTFTYNCPPSTYFDSTKSLCMVGTCPATTTTTVVAPVTDITSITSNTSPATTLSPGYVCPSEGKFQDPFTCAAYYQCILINGSWYTYKYNCPVGLIWNSTAQVCTVGTC